MKILVTGGSGFIGTNLIDELIKDSKLNLINVDICYPRNKAHEYLWEEGDINNRKFMDQLFSKHNPELVVHLAARTDLEGTNLNDYSTNIAGLEQIIECCNSSKSVKRAIFFSSMLVCSLGYQPKNDKDFCPTTLYGKSKMIGENIVRKKLSKDIEWSILRPTSLWGPWFDVPYKNFFDAVRSGFFMMPDKLKVFRSYGFVLNSVEQIKAIMYTKDNHFLHCVHYLADHEPIELSDWARCIIEVSEQGKVFYTSANLLKLLAIMGDGLKKMGFKSPPLTSFRLKNMVTNAVYSTVSWDKLYSKQNYSMREGVKITVDWLNNLERK